MTQFELFALSLVKAIPRGRVATYKILAREAGKPRAFRAVANALHKNKKNIIIPCHRVIKSNGDLGGYNRGKKFKRQLLESEGIEIKDEEVVDFEKYLYKPKI